MLLYLFWKQHKLLLSMIYAATAVLETASTFDIMPYIDVVELQ
jgi:hypothetical protein